MRLSSLILRSAGDVVDLQCLVVPGAAFAMSTDGVVDSSAHAVADTAVTALSMPTDVTQLETVSLTDVTLWETVLPTDVKVWGATTVSCCFNK